MHENTDKKIKNKDRKVVKHYIILLSNAFIKDPSYYAGQMLNKACKVVDSENKAVRLKSKRTMMRSLKVIRETFKNQSWKTVQVKLKIYYTNNTIETVNITKYFASGVVNIKLNFARTLNRDCIYE